jgi:hypothetical protein
MTDNTQGTRTIILPEDLYSSLQELKQIFSQMTGQEITEDADVIGILLSAFIDSVQGMQEGGEEGQQDS